MTFPLMPTFAPSGGLTNISLFATATSTSSTIVVPSGVQSGDLLLLVDAPSSTSIIGSGSSPAGFTTLASVAFSGWFNGCQISAKLSDGTEAGTTVTGMNGNSSNAKLMYVFRGNQSILSFTGLNLATSMTDGSSGLQTLAITGVASPCIALCTASTRNAATVSFSSVSPALVVNTSVSRLAAGYRIVNSPTSPTAQNFSMNDFGQGNCLAGLWLNLA